MKRLGIVLVLIVVLIAFAGTVAFLVSEAFEPPVIYETHPPKTVDIVKKTVATGAIVPRNEVALKSRVSGILDTVLVEPGESVEQGDLIARIRVIPDPQALQRAASGVRTARINLDDAVARLAEDEALYEDGALAAADLERRRVEVARRREELRAATDQLTLVRDGALRNADAVSTDIRSTVEGMVLDVPVERGMSITETNTFSEGTTIAFVADMTDMIFEGKVDESEVGRIREGMPLTITVGALDNATLDGTLEFIAPKGVLEEGAVQFAIKAAVEREEGGLVRAGSSANADIVLDRRQQVLGLREALLQFDGRDPYVEVEVAPQQFERRDVELGLSDGLVVEVKSGLSLEDQVKGRPQEG